VLVPPVTMVCFLPTESRVRGRSEGVVSGVAMVVLQDLSVGFTPYLTPVGKMTLSLHPKNCG